jgi:hypothetical protein
MREIMNILMFGTITLSQASCDIDLDFYSADRHLLSHDEIVFSRGDPHHTDICIGSHDWWILEVITGDGRFIPDYDTRSKGYHVNVFIDAGWLTVERTGARSLRVEVVPNRSERRRAATICLWIEGHAERALVVQLSDNE